MVGAPLPEDTHAVALTVPDEAALRALSDRLAFEGIEHRLICEPDLNGQATALGVCPQPREKRLRRLLSRFPLLR